MSYHHARGSKPPKTKQEKSAAARQFFVTASILGAIAFAYLGWVYWHEKKQAELSKTQTESSKANEELFRDLAQMQKRAAPQKPSPSPANEPPTTKSQGIGHWRLYILPIILGVLSFLTFFTGLIYTVEARRMAETPET